MKSLTHYIQEKLIIKKSPNYKYFPKTNEELKDIIKLRIETEGSEVDLNDIEVSKITIYNYIEYMCRALLINKADRYDVRGKRILNGKYKYYLTDLGLGQVINSERKKQMGAYLENIVYNELLSRGYEVKVGTLTNGEIDFIATRYEEKIY